MTFERPLLRTSSAAPRRTSPSNRSDSNFSTTVIIIPSARHSFGSARFPVKVQDADVRLVDVPEAVAGTVNLLHELSISQPGLQRLISETSFTGEEKILPIRRNDGAEI